MARSVRFNRVSRANMANTVNRFHWFQMKTEVKTFGLGWEDGTEFINVYHGISIQWFYRVGNK
jgi:hypothetical protein